MARDKLAELWAAMNVALFFLFIGLPLVELALLIKFGQAYGFWSVMGVILVTALAGFFILQTYGFTVMRKASEAVQRGETAFDAMHDGAFVAFAGILLIFPGLIGDVVGLLLLIPPVRRLVAGLSLKWIGQGFRVTTIQTGPRGPYRTDSAEARGEPTGPTARPTRGTSPRPTGPFASGPIIEGEFERIDEKTADPNRPSGDRKS